MKGWISCALLSLVPLLLLADALRPGRMLADAGLEQRVPWAASSTDAERHLPQINDDTVRESLVYRVQLHETIGRGVVPWWSPHSFAGIPFVALSNTQTLYPFSWLAAALDPLTAHTWLIALHLCLAGLGMRAWLRSLRCSESASLLGAIAFMLNGMFVSRHGHPQYVATACWLPFILLGVEWIAAGRRAGIACIAGSVALAVLAGHPSIYVFGFYFVAAWVVARLWTGAPPDGSWQWRGRTLLAVAVAAAIGLGLASTQLLATAELSDFSNRGTRSFEALATRLTHWSHLLRMPFADLTGSALRGDYWSVSPTEHRAANLHFGIPPLLLAVIGAARGGRNGLVLAAIGAGCLAVMFFEPVFSIAYRTLPGFQFGRVDRISIAVFLAAAPLAALGLDAVTGGRGGRAFGGGISAWQIALLAAGGLVVAALAVASVWSLAPPERMVEARATAWRSLLWSAGWGVATLACLFAATRSRRSWLPAALIGLTVVSLGAYARSFVVVREQSRMFRETESIRWLQSRPGVFRIAKFGGRLGPYDYRIFPANTPSVFGLEDVHGFGPMHPRHLDLLVRAVEPGMGRSAWHLRPFRKPASLDSGVLDLMAKYVLAEAPLPDSSLELTYHGEDGLYIYENRDALERVHFVAAARLSPDFREAAELLASGDIDPHRTVLLHGVDELPTLDAAERASPCPAAPEVEILSYSDGRIEARCRSSRPGYLLLLTSYFPGWHAQIDGGPARLLRADVSFQALPIAAGDHRVVFEYVPTHRSLALASTSLSVVVLVAAIVGLPRSVFGPREPGASS